MEQRLRGRDMTETPLVLRESRRGPRGLGVGVRRVPVVEIQRLALQRRGIADPALPGEGSARLVWARATAKWPAP
jgi:hypothetical protein